jgi:protocatechuate 3,4-dioxygenase beta subunit
MVSGLGGLAITGTLGSVLTQEGRRHLTPEVEMGPFYPRMKPLDTDADLTVLAGRTGRAEGRVVNLSGRVLNQRGEPVAGAKVEIWQANTHGRYANVSDPNPAPLDPNFQGYGVQVTDAEGRYRFTTIRPGPYPESPTAVRTPHIHFDVTGRVNRKVTQMFFAGEPLNEQDRLLQQVSYNKPGVLAAVSGPTGDMAPDSLLVRWDVVIATG